MNGAIWLFFKWCAHSTNIQLYCSVWTDQAGKLWWHREKYKLYVWLWEGWSHGRSITATLLGKVGLCAFYVYGKVTAILKKGPHLYTQEKTSYDIVLYSTYFLLSQDNVCDMPITLDILIARFMGPTWGPSGADRTQVGPMLASWTLLSG